jgi:hypothetical protein
VTGLRARNETTVNAKAFSGALGDFGINRLPAERIFRPLVGNEKPLALLDYRAERLNKDVGLLNYMNQDLSLKVEIEGMKFLTSFLASLLEISQIVAGTTCVEDD